MSITQRPFVVSHNIHEPNPVKKVYCRCPFVFQCVVLILFVCIIFNSYLYCLYLKMYNEFDEIQQLRDDIKRLKAEVGKLANKTDRKPIIQHMRDFGLKESESEQYRSVGTMAVNIDEESDLVDQEDASDNLASQDYDGDDDENEDDYEFNKSKQESIFDNRHPPPAPDLTKRKNNFIISTRSPQIEILTVINNQSFTILDDLSRNRNQTSSRKNTISASVSTSPVIRSMNKSIHLPNSQNSHEPRLLKRNAEILSSKDINDLEKKCETKTEIKKNQKPNERLKDENTTMVLFTEDHLNGSIIVQSTVSESTTTHHPKDLGIRPISISSITVKEKAKTKRGLIPIDYDRSSTIDANPYLRSSMRKPQQQKSDNLRKLSSVSQHNDDNIEEIETITELNQIQKGQNQINIVIAAHFGADNSPYNRKTHSNYKGNGRFSHPTGEYKDWKASDWHNNYEVNNYLTLSNGDITIHTQGLYFVYAQIFFQDNSDANGYRILKNFETVLQCITTSYSTAPSSAVIESMTCYTGGIVYCSTGDKLSVKSDYSNRHIVLEPSKSFFGVFKVG